LPCWASANCNTVAIRDPGAGDASPCGCAGLAPAGSDKVMPGMIKLVAVMLLAASKAASVTPLRAAILLNESPARTV
jgi:hypothetical protein